MNKILTQISLFVIFMLSVNMTLSQTISGKVADQKNEILFGATVVIEGTTIGNTTDLEGDFTIPNVKPGKYNLVFSYIGYAKLKKAIEVVAGKDLDLGLIKMEEDKKMLTEVVAVGYGTTQKRDVTGSISTVKAKDLQNVPMTSFEQSIQGKAAGVQITSANGAPGGAVKVQVRGTSSISAGSEPLYVVDGIPITTGDFGDPSKGSRTSAMADINPNDIESIEVLKDAAAAAIYGSRGANGVVLITTKRGKAGKTKFSAGYYGGVTTPARVLEYLDAKEQLALRDSSAARNGFAADVPTTNLGSGVTRAMADSIAAAGGSNWIDQTIRTGSLHEFNLSAQGGDEKTQFYVGGTYRKENSFLVGNSYERINGRINLDHKASKIFKLGTSTGLTYSVNNRVPMGDEGGLGRAQELLPYIPIYDQQGGYWNAYDNPVWALSTKKYKTNVFRTVANVYGDLQLYKDLTFRSEFGLDVFNQWENEYNFRNVQDSTSTSNAYDRRTLVLNYTTNNFFTYNKDAGKSNFNITLGNSYQHSYTRGVGLQGLNLPNDYLTNPGSASSGNQSGYAYETGYAFTSYFLRFNYKLMNRYLLGLSMRADGSSRFGDNNRWGYFPAFSAGWIISDENFLKNSLVLTYLKIRASYGFTGNANIGDFAALGYYVTTNGYNGQNGLIPSTLPNPNLSWEKSQQLDVTLDFALIKDKISGTITYYNKQTSDLLLYIKLPTSTGFSSVLQNVGKLQNSGWEFSLTTRQLNKGFKWSTDFNLAMNQNKVTDVNGLPPDAFDNGVGGDARVVQGFPVGIAYLVRYAGVSQTDQELQKFDVNGNPVLNSDGTNQTFSVRAGEALYYDRNGKLMAYGVDTKGSGTADDVNRFPGSSFYDERVPRGSPVPKFFGGITNNLSWKGIDLSFMFIFVYGNTIYDDAAKNQIGNYTGQAQRTEILNAWTAQNQSNVPALDKNYVPVNSDRFLYDGSFVRLRNITLGYNFPEKFANKMKLGSMRIFVTAQNLLTFTKYPGWDPEVLRNTPAGNSQDANISFASPSKPTPQAKIFTAGINITF